MEHPPPSTDDLAKFFSAFEGLCKKLDERSEDSSATGPGVLGHLLIQMARINSQMFDGSVRALHGLNTDLNRENADLRSENASLRKQLDEATSNKLDREFQMSMVVEANRRSDQLMATLFRMIQEQNTKSQQATSSA